MPVRSSVNKEYKAMCWLWLQKLLRIPAYSREEQEKADYLVELLLEKGWTVNRQGNNLWLEHLPEQEEAPVIWLNSHLDTVKPVTGWKTNPLDAEDREGQITALGSNDAGASLLSLLAVFLTLHDENVPAHLIFVASAEEEVSGSNGIGSILDRLTPPDIAIVGEPTGMQLAVAERGLLVLDGVIKGVSGHAAHQNGVNAIYNALPVIEKIRDYRFIHKSEWFGEMIAQVTQIQAGHQHNVIPGECWITLDIRLTDQYTHDMAIKELSDATGITFQARSKRFMPSVVPEEHVILKAARQEGFGTFVSNTLSDQALIPYTSVKIGPGDTLRSHTAGEYILKSEFDEGCEKYYRLIKSYLNEIME